MATDLLIVAGFGFVAVVIVFILIAKRNRVTFEERFPRISDAEFLALCKPGINPEVALKVRRLIAKQFSIEYERVHPSMRFIEDICGLGGGV
jgi:hypothetical protein